MTMDQSEAFPELATTTTDAPERRCATCCFPQARAGGRPWCPIRGVPAVPSGGRGCLHYLPDLDEPAGILALERKEIEAERAKRRQVASLKQNQDETVVENFP